MYRRLLFPSMCMWGCMAAPVDATTTFEYRGSTLTGPSELSSPPFKYPAAPGATAVTMRIELDLPIPPRNVQISYGAGDSFFSWRQTIRPVPASWNSGKVSAVEVSDGDRVVRLGGLGATVRFNLTVDEAGEVTKWNMVAALESSRTRGHIESTYYAQAPCPFRDMTYYSDSKPVESRGVYSYPTYFSASCTPGKWTVTGSPDCATPPKYGDVIVYRRAKLVTHSGIVRATEGCRVMTILSKEDTGGSVRTRSPDASELEKYGEWTIYRSDRLATSCGGHADQCLATARDPNRLIDGYDDGFFRRHSYFTDKDLDHEIFGIWVGVDGGPFIQCHGFTFGGLDKTLTAISGEYVDRILDENNYKRLVVFGPDGARH